MVPRHHTFNGGPVIGFVCLFAGLLFFSPLIGQVLAGTADDLIIGEALYMAGNLNEAAGHLQDAARSGTPAQVHRALYLLGRINLLRGDFRQAKEYFERSADISAGGTTGEWMALAGIGDTLYASGHYEEAIRRYRIALSRSNEGREGAVIGLKIALCERALGRHEKALANIRESLRRIPVLSGWVGREEEFYHSMVMEGIAPVEHAVTRTFIVAGPIRGDFSVEGLVARDMPVSESRKGSRTYLEFGPLSDPVEAMILSEKLRSRYAVTVEIVNR
jgi:hypothetical protein